MAANTNSVPFCLFCSTPPNLYTETILCLLHFSCSIQLSISYHFNPKAICVNWHEESSGRGRGRWWGFVERNLLSTAEHFVGSSLLSSNTHEVKVVQIVGDRVVHVLIISLSTHLISIESIHSGPKTWDTLGQGVILSGLPAPNKDIMGRRLVLLHWSHPPPNCSLKCQGGILFDVFRVVQQVHLQSFPSFSIVVVPTVNEMKERRFLLIEISNQKQANRFYRLVGQWLLLSTTCRWLW